MGDFIRSVKEKGIIMLIYYGIAIILMLIMSFCFDKGTEFKWVANLLLNLGVGIITALLMQWFFKKFNKSREENNTKVLCLSLGKPLTKYLSEIFNIYREVTPDLHGGGYFWLGITADNILNKNVAQEIFSANLDKNIFGGNRNTTVGMFLKEIHEELFNSILQATTTSTWMIDDEFDKNLKGVLSSAVMVYYKEYQSSKYDKSIQGDFYDASSEWKRTEVTDKPTDADVKEFFCMLKWIYKKHDELVPTDKIKISGRNQYPG